MALQRRSGRSRATLVFLILLSITLITLDFRGSGSGVIDGLRDVASDALSPVRNVADGVLSPVGDGLQGITGYGALEDENAELRDRIAELEGDALESEAAAEELEEALDLLGVDFVGDIPTVAARVVSAPVSNFEQTIELDRGSDDGIAVDMPVVSGSGLVGKVVQVSGSRSVVRLISDPGSSVGIRFVHANEGGVAEGEGADRDLSVSFVEVNVELRRRELAVTSGVNDSVFPPGIPVGRIDSARSADGELQQDVRLVPSADLDHLRFVRVLQRTRPTPTTTTTTTAPTTTTVAP
ncbi:MAG TPA: rod shape-determining protein MreC [Acidimicrobiales bacterium]|nr:rod shape-determining protein MreC [Acidimicrobiales bacterium]